MFAGHFAHEIPFRISFNRPFPQNYLDCIPDKFHNNANSRTQLLSYDFLFTVRNSRLHKFNDPQEYIRDKFGECVQMVCRTFGLHTRTERDIVRHFPGIKTDLFPPAATASISTPTFFSSVNPSAGNSSRVNGRRSFFVVRRV